MIKNINIPEIASVTDVTKSAKLNSGAFNSKRYSVEPLSEQGDRSEVHTELTH